MIRVFDYLASLPGLEEELLAQIRKVLRSGQLILGPETRAFEQEFAAYVGAEHCIGVSSGTTALHLGMLALGIGPGDEVITVSNTCVPTIAAIRLTGATPVFVDVRDRDLMFDTDRLTSKITSRTRCIVPVHLWGNAVQIDRIVEIARENKLYVVEDCAQAHGTLFRGTHVGTFGDLGCFSFYPTKNIGAYGDAGAVVCRNDELAERIRAMRMYGYDRHAVSQVEGMNARIEEIQAAILRVKLQIFPEWLERRRDVARRYHQTIRNPAIRLPVHSSDVEPSYHQFVIRCEDRDAMTRQFEANNIGYGIHYPIPVHRMPGYRFLGGNGLDLPVTDRAAREILSLPVHEALTDAEVNQVVHCLNGA